MHLFGGGSKKNDVTLLFDIANASVGAAIVDLSTSEKPKIVYSARVPIDFQRSINAKRFLVAAGASLETLCGRILSEYVQKGKHSLRINGATCLFASPWLMSQPIIIRYAPEKQFALTHELLDKLVEQEHIHFEKAFSHDGRKSAVQTIEAKVLGTRLNGYELSSIHGQYGKEAIIDMFFSAASSEAIALFEKIIHNTFHVGEVSFSSFLLAYWNAIRDSRPETLDFVCLDITGEVTDILVANRGVITNVSSFPIGAHAVARTIINSTNMPPESALSVQSLASGSKKEAVDPVVQKAIGSALEEWIGATKEALLQINTHTILPKTMYVTIDENVSGPFVDALKELEHDALGVGKEHFSLSVISKEFISTDLVLAEGVVVDPFLLIGALYLRKIHNHADEK